jgi:hypothetical protein
MEALVGVIKRAARRGSAVWDVILRAGVGAAGAEDLVTASRDVGRVVAASSASLRLTRFAVGLPNETKGQQVVTMQSRRDKYGGRMSVQVESRAKCSRNTCTGRLRKLNTHHQRDRREKQDVHLVRSL